VSATKTHPNQSKQTPQVSTKTDQGKNGAGASAPKPPATPTQAAASASDAAAEAAMNAGKAAKATTTKSGPAPGGLTWVDWYKHGHRVEGRPGKELEAAYIKLRTPEYNFPAKGKTAEERMKVLARHAYRHRMLAIPETKGENVPTPAATA